MDMMELQMRRVLFRLRCLLLACLHRPHQDIHRAMHREAEVLITVAVVAFGGTLHRVWVVLLLEKCSHGTLKVATTIIMEEEDLTFKKKEGTTFKEIAEEEKTFLAIGEYFMIKDRKRESIVINTNNLNVDLMFVCKGQK